MKVLIVDDSLTVRMDLSEAFEEDGWQVQPCATAQEAREALARGPVDVMVLDVILPDAHGVEFLRELRAADMQCVVLMLSSESDVKDRILGLKTGADEFVGKPYDSDYVVARARELADARSPATVSTKSLVLLIDDSPTVLETLRISLEDAGYRVITAASGEEGLRLAAAHRPSALLVDGVLPGIDGATVIRRIRLDAALRATPCILLTGSVGEGAELRFLEAGADAFVRKEEAREILLARLSAVLRGATEVPANEAPASLMGPKKILAVDDSPTYLHELASALTGEGFDVVLARSGEEALEMLAVQTVDCILLDLLMPGIGGAETCRFIKSSPGVRDIPLIILTSMEDRDSMVSGLGAGADDYIAKGSDFEVLRARLRAQLRRKQFESERRGMHARLLQKELEAAEARSARELAEARAVLINELQFKNKELEAFSYSVSHDLRAPLRAIDGFSAVLQRDYTERLDDRGRHYLSRVRAGTERMSHLIDDMLKLSRITSAPVHRTPCDVTQAARSVLEELRSRDAERQVEVEVAEGLEVSADPRLLEVLLENLLGNAWKFTSREPHGHIEVKEHRPGVFCVRDNGSGFDMSLADKLFAPFQRFHSDSEFEGTGIGLATVWRVVARHHGQVWAETAVNQGATFFFSLGDDDE